MSFSSENPCCGFHSEKEKYQSSLLLDNGYPGLPAFDQGFPEILQRCTTEFVPATVLFGSMQ
jgi:hypothetical protein